MKTRLLFASSMLTYSLLMGAGCKSKDASHASTAATPDCAAAIAKYVEGPVQKHYLDGIATQRAKTNPAPPTDEDKQADAKLWNAAAPGWKDAITTRCVEDKWSAASIECYAKTTAAEPDCGLTDAQKSALANMPSK